jgi:hypothetical protein
LNRSRKQKILAGAAVAALIAGGTIAAVAGTGGDSGSRARGTAAGRAPQLPPHGDLAVAAAYLGIAPARLLDDLRSAQTLAQVASATKGRSVAGLIDRIVAAREATLAAAARSGQITAAQEKGAIASLRARVRVRVNRVGGYPTAVGRRAVAAPAAAAAYLGISQTRLRDELRAGKTLAELANGARGKSASGLIAAIVADTKARLAIAVAAGRLTPASEKLLLARLQRRIATEVNGPRGEGASGR